MKSKVSFKIFIIFIISLFLGSLGSYFCQAETQDYYKTLGLSKNADENDIKRAYRRLAVKWHPDKNPDNRKAAEAEFKKISEAYEVLSDSEKRKVYDQYGQEGYQQFAQGGGTPPGGGGFFPGAGGMGSGDYSFGFDQTGFTDPRELFEKMFGG
eukprot:CAMPEP_0117877770 /NCGR_PEP_ID=MMETSP0950-20121206/14428_1 /TAXON_ID=44440 /ORGANISM="Chattonella subsalsa, Strain CCMP2191" /LENGTH=153 /DNA_ID=CAMNT_0005731901 /DNA_START=50 /DNA_END=508 /DNA_ORIENTATION=+